MVEDCPDDCVCGVKKMHEDLNAQLHVDGLRLDETKDELVQRLIERLISIAVVSSHVIFVNTYKQ